MTKQSRRLIVLSLIALLPALSLQFAHTRRLSHHTKRCGRSSWSGCLKLLPSMDRRALCFIAYRDLLIKTGISTQEADQRLDVLRRMHRERPDAWRVMFNIIYASEKPGLCH